MGLQSSPLSTSRTSLSSQSEIPYRLNILKIHCRYWKWDLTEVSVSGLCWQLGNPSRWHLGSCGRSRWVEPATAKPFAPHCPPALPQAWKWGQGSSRQSAVMTGRNDQPLLPMRVVGACGPKNAVGLSKLQKARKRILSESLEKNTALPTLLLAPQDPPGLLTSSNNYAFFFFLSYLFILTALSLFCCL